MSASTMRTTLLMYRPPFLGDPKPTKGRSCTRSHWPLNVQGDLFGLGRTATTVSEESRRCEVAEAGGCTEAGMGTSGDD